MFKKIILGLFALATVAMADTVTVYFNNGTPSETYKTMSYSQIKSKLDENPIAFDDEAKDGIILKDYVKSIERNPFDPSLYSVKTRKGFNILVWDELSVRKLKSLKRGDKIIFIASDFTKGIFDNEIMVKTVIFMTINGNHLNPAIDRYTIKEDNK